MTPCRLKSKKWICLYLCEGRVRNRPIRDSFRLRLLEILLPESVSSDEVLNVLSRAKACHT